jgi:hypothetical protein
MHCQYLVGVPELPHLLFQFSDALRIPGAACRPLAAVIKLRLPAAPYLGIYDYRVEIGFLVRHCELLCISPRYQGVLLDTGIDLPGSQARQAVSAQSPYFCDSVH